MPAKVIDGPTFRTCQETRKRSKKIKTSTVVMDGPTFLTCTQRGVSTEGVGTNRKKESWCVDGAWVGKDNMGENNKKKRGRELEYGWGGASVGKDN